MRIFAFFVLISFIGINIYAQEKSEDFAITGKPIVNVFANYHAGFGDNNKISGFELTRAYLGYEFKLSPSLRGKAVIDAGIPSAEAFMATQKRDIYLRFAQLTWEDKGFKISGGLTELYQFKVQQKAWGHRYVAQSYQDLYKMGSSSDLGVTIEYHFTPWLDADLSLTNGEGYKYINKDNRYRYALGITTKPVSGLTLRVYGDSYKQTEAASTQRTLALFGGYTCNYFSLGAEYNYQENNQFKSDMDYYGYSIYSTVPLNKKWNLFGRYDSIDSKDKDSNSWISFTGEMLIAGIEFIPMKNLKFALNYKYAKDFDTSLLAHNTFHTAYFNVDFVW